MLYPFQRNTKDKKKNVDLTTFYQGMQRMQRNNGAGGESRKDY